jgi:hypothetical protein
MGKYVNYAAAALGALFVITLVFWANWGAVTTSTAGVGSNAAISPHEIMRGSTNLPVQTVRDPF